MDIVLYQFPGACSRVTLNALEEIGMPYLLRTVNLREGGQNAGDYLALNPKGQVPVVTFDGRILTENAAILFALHTCYPDANLLPNVQGFPAMWECLSDLTWCSSTLHPIVRQVRMPSKWTKGNPEDVAADGQEKMAKQCAIFSEHFINGGWWYGALWSILDVYIYWCYSTAARGGFSVTNYPELLAHAARVRKRRSFQRASTAERESAFAAGIEMPVEQL